MLVDKVWEILLNKTQVALLLLIAFCSLGYYLVLSKRQRLPTGPVGIPIFGNMFQLKNKNLLEEFIVYRQKYGDIFSIRIGACLMIFLNGYDVIKEVLHTNGDQFVHRPNNFVNEYILEHKGIVSRNGESWKEQRAFCTSALRYFGVGRKNIETPIRNECQKLVNAILKTEGKLFDVQFLVKQAISRVMCFLFFGSLDDFCTEEKSAELDKLVKNFVDSFTSFSAVGMFNAFPFLRMLPGDMLGQRKIKTNYDAILDFMHKRIDEHKRNVETHEPEDIIDLFLLEMKKYQTKKDSAFSERQLAHLVTDFFLAGKETTAATINWCIVYLLHNPGVQDKLHIEIDSEIGSSSPTMQHKKNMNYMSAFMEEVQRISTVTPFGCEHAPVSDTSLFGFYVPKEAAIIPNLYSVSFDEKIFPEPRKFVPERYLDEDGKYHPSEKNIPFCIGRRVCLGESMAKTEIFLFMTTLLQNFYLLEADEGLPSLTPMVLGSCTPADFKVKAILRN